MNIPMGVRKYICQNENLVRLVKKFIGNFATPVPTKGDFCLINNYRTINLKRRFRWFGLVVKRSEPWQALSCRVKSRGQQDGDWTI